MRRSILVWTQYILLIIVLAVAFIPNVEARSTEKLGVYADYDLSKKEISITNILNPIATLKLEDNHCEIIKGSTDSLCYATIRFTDFAGLDTSEKNQYFFSWDTYNGNLKGWDWTWYEVNTDTKKEKYDCVVSVTNNTVYVNNTYYYPEIKNMGKCDRDIITITETEIELGKKLNKNKEYVIRITGTLAPNSAVEWFNNFYGIKITEWAWWLTNYTYVRNVTINTTVTSNINKMLIPLNGTSCIEDGTNRECIYCLMPVLKAGSDTLTFYNNLNNYKCGNVTGTEEYKIAKIAGNGTGSSLNKNATFQSANVIWAWSFNDSAAVTDETGLRGGSKIIYNYTYTLYPKGLFGSALQLLGNNSRFELNTDSINEGEAHSIEFWIKNFTKEPEAIQCSIFTMWAGGGSKNMVLFLNDTGIDEIRVSKGGFSFSSYFANISASSSQWTHIVITTDGSSASGTGVNGTAYINGKMASQWTQRSEDITTDGSGIGRGIDVTSCTGILVDEFRYYNLTLTPEEIKARYEIFSPLLNYTTMGNASFTVSWWNNNWTKRKEIQLSSPQDITDQQVKIKINITNELANGSINAGCQNVRFINRTNNEVPYYIELCQPGKISVFHVRMAELPDTVYMYYGNTAATNTTMNGTAVFEAFYDGTTATINQWTYFEDPLADPDWCNITHDTTINQMVFNDCVRDRKYAVRKTIPAIINFTWEQSWKIDSFTGGGYSYASGPNDGTAVLQGAGETYGIHTTTWHGSTINRSDILWDSNQYTIGPNATAIQIGTTYYLTFTRDGTNMTQTFYQDKERTDIVQRINGTYSSATRSFTTWNFLVNYLNDGNTEKINGRATNLTVSKNPGFDINVSISQEYSEGEELFNPNLTACQNINAAGDYVLLNSINNYDTGNCFVITTSNVNIDCQSNIVDGDNSYFAFDAETPIVNITIKNCYLSEWDNGIYFDSVNYSEIINVTLQDEVARGIDISNSNYINITDISGTNSADSMINFLNSRYIIIENSETSSAGNCGIYFTNTHDSNITNTTETLMSAGGGICLARSSRNLITNNTLDNNANGLFFIEGVIQPFSQNNTIYNNFFNNTNKNVEYNANNYPIDATNYFNVTKQAGTNIIGKEGIGGNYWGDYNGYSSTGEYFGDVPYSMYDSEENLEDQDFLPLMYGNLSYIPLTSCANINNSGFYRLMNSIIDYGSNICFQISNSVGNVEIDCNGYTIDGIDTESTASSALYNYGATNLSVKNCVFTDWYAGGKFDNLVYSTFSNITGSSNWIGLWFLTSSYNNISDMNMNSNIYYSILLQDSSSFFKVSNINLSNDGENGIFIRDDSDKNILTNITTSSIPISIYFRYADSNNLTNTNITGPTCVSFVESNGNLLYNNFFNCSFDNINTDSSSNFFNTTKTAGTNILGKPGIGGNFWSDYIGYSFNEDYFGDIPYYVASEDSLPLVENNYSHVAMEIQNIDITPANVYKADTMNCSANYATDFPPINGTVTLSWLNGSVQYSSNTISNVQNNQMISLSLPASIQHKGEIWNCSINASDGYVANITSATKTILNTAPVITFVNYNPNSSVYKTTIGLNCSITATDVDSGDTFVYSYLHFKNNVTTGITTQNVTNATYSKGDVMTCQGRVFDGTDYSSYLNSSNISVLNSVPSLIVTLNPSSNIYKTTVGINATLSVNDADEDAISLAYLWYYNNISTVTETSQNISNSSSYFVRGNTLTAQVTANDGETSVMANSSNLTILNSIPVLASVTIIPSSDVYKTTVGINATATYEDADSDSVTYTYLWHYNNISTVTETSQNISNSSSYFVHFNTLTAQVKANDGYDTSVPKNSSNVTILNTVPVAETVPTLNPSTNVYKTTVGVNCTPGTGTYDADSDSVTNQYVWYNNGALAGVTTQNITNSSFNKNDEILCQWNIYDGYAASNKLNSSSTIILNSAPVSGTPTLTPAPLAYTSNDLNCSFVYTADSDNDKANATIRWYKNNISIITQQLTGSYSVSGVISSLLLSGNLTATDIWNCEAFVIDSSGVNSVPFNSSTSLIYNTPEIIVTNIFPLNGTISESQDVTFQCNGSSSNPLQSVQFIVKPKEAGNQTIQRTVPDEYSRNGGVSISNEAYAHDNDNNLITRAQLGASGGGTVTSYWYYNFSKRSLNATLDIAGLLGYGGSGDDIIFNIALWNYTTSTWTNIFTHTSTWPTTQNIKDNYLPPADTLSGDNLRIRLELTQKNLGVGSEINGTRVTWNMKNSSVKTIIGSPNYSQDNFTNYFYYNGDYIWNCIYNDTLTTANASAEFTFEHFPLSTWSTLPLNTTYATTNIPVNIYSSYEVTSCYYSINSGSNNSMAQINSTYFIANATGVEGSNHIVIGCFDNVSFWNSTQQYFAVDTTAPVITITNPISYQLYLADNVAFDYSVSSGAASCWMNLNNGPNMTIDATSGSHTLALFDLGNITLNMFCRDALYNYGSASVNFYSKPVVEICGTENDKWINLGTYTGSGYLNLTLPPECIGETIVFRNSLSASTSSNSFAEAKIVWGAIEQLGKNATAIEGNCGASGTCPNCYDNSFGTSGSIGGAGATNPTNISYNFSNPSHWPMAKIVLAYSAGPTTNPPPMTFWCYNNQRNSVLNYDVLDESTNASLTAALTSSIMTAWYNGYQNYNTSSSSSSSTGNNRYSFCAWPPAKDIKLDYSITLTNTSYGARTFKPLAPLTVNTNTPLNYIAYLLNYADGITAYFKAIDQYGTGIPLVLGIMIKNSIVINTGYTDGAGMVSFFADPDETYTFSFSKTGYTSASTTLKPIPTTYTVQMTNQTTVVYANASFWDGLSWAANPLDTLLGANFTVNLTFSFNSTTCSIINATITAVTSNGTTYVNSTANPCSNYVILPVNTANNTEMRVSQCMYRTITWSAGVFQCNYINYGIMKGIYAPAKFSLKTILEDIDNFTGLGINKFTKALFFFVLLIFLISRLPNVTMYANEFIIGMVVIGSAISTYYLHIMDIPIFWIITVGGIALGYLSLSSKI